MKILIFLGLITFPTVINASGHSKPDLQKAYNEGLSWSKAKVKDMPDLKQSATTANSPTTGVCRGGQDDKGHLAIAPGCKKNQKEKEKEQHQTHTAIKDPKILVFVSFSMPKASLNALAKEAEKFGAVLIMRGLKDDSFIKTQIAFQALGEEEKSGIEINPELFDTYQIKQVPVFVRVKSTPAGDLQEISRISGNMSLAFAAQKLEETP